MIPTVPGDLHSFSRTRPFRTIARLLIFLLVAQSFPFDALQARVGAGGSSGGEAHAATTILWVDAAGSCGGQTPCYSTIQSAINAVQAGQTVRILPGQYVEQLVIKQKNAASRSSERDRITIEADPDSPVGSVVLSGHKDRCEGGYGVDFDRSKYVTLRGLVISGAGLRGVVLRGGSRQNKGIRLERNKLYRGSTRECSGGIDVGRGNPDTVIANNILYANGRNGLRFRDATGGSYLVVENTIVRSGWNGIYITRAAKARIWNNIIAFNGTAPGVQGNGRYGLKRQLISNPRPQDVDLKNNLICGNTLGEITGPVLDAADAGNQTPTGTEGPGVIASPTCAQVAALFANLAGQDGTLDTGDDEFLLAQSSPAIDRGLDPRAQGTSIPDALFEADYFRASVRPQDGDGDETASFDIGAVELGGRIEPTPTPTPSATPSSTPTPTGTPIATPTPIPATPTPTIAPTPTPTIVPPTPTPTPEPTPTPTPTSTPEPTPTPAPSGTPNHPPLASPDSYVAHIGQTLHVPAPGVLGNDTDPDHDPLTAMKLSDPTNGQLVFNPDGSFDYTPNNGIEPHLFEGNLSQMPGGVTVNVSSTYPFPLYVASSAIDGDLNTSWFTAPGDAANLGKTPFYEIVFPQDATITQLQMFGNRTLAVGFDFHAGKFQLFDVNDNVLFDSGVVDLPAPDRDITVDVPNVAGVRRVRFTGTADESSDPGFAELKVFGSTFVTALDPVVKWSWTGSTVAPDFTQVIVTPIVANLTDDNGDGKIDEKDVPDIVFVTSNRVDLGMCSGDGVLRAISGSDGSSVFDVTDPALAVSNCNPVAIGDLDGDGVPEIVAIQEAGAHLVIFNHDGTLRRSVSLGPLTTFSRPAASIADLDGDGSPEIIVGATVFDHTGTLLWSHADPGNAGFGGISTAADLDLDGKLEVVTGFQAYRADGGAFYATPGQETQGGYPAVGNFDDDPFPEVVVVSNGSVYLLRHDGTVKPGWPVAIPLGGFGGTPTIADFDGDGQAEIGVAGASRYTVFRADGSILWQSETRDTSSSSTASSVFDFEHDGSAEVIYNDELFLRIFKGSTGEVLFKDKNPSCTATENPVVVDVDNDGHADIVVARNNICGFGTTEGVTDAGIFVYTGRGNDWVRTRRIWNEHAYHVTNVNEDGSIPAHETKNWLAPGLNNFRQQAFAPGDRDTADHFTYKASDGQLASNVATVSIDVVQPNNPPSITSDPVTSAAATAPYLYAVQATDPDAGDVLTFSLPTAPSGMTIDPPTGLIQWTPSIDQIGTQSVVVKVQDALGLFALQSYTVTVAVAPTPTPIVATPTPTPGVTPTPTPEPTATPTPTPNHPPVASPDSYVAHVGQTLHVPAPGVLGNDSDPDHDALSAAKLTDPANGQLAFNADGSFDYTPSDATDTVLVQGNLIQLIAGVTATASSSYGASFPPSSAIDGDLNTSWFTQNGDAANLGQSPFLEVDFPQDVTVTELDLFGNRQYAVGFSILAGDFKLFDQAGNVLFDSGVVSMSGPNHDAVVPVPSTDHVRRVRFTATADESIEPGFAELEVIGSATLHPLQPVVKWSWTGSTVAPDYNQAIVTPIVANLTDDNGDGKIDENDIPDVIYPTSNRLDGSLCFGDGVLRAISGKDGSAIFDVTDPTLAVANCNPVAVGDLDGDGVPEIVATQESTSNLLIFNHDGTLRHRSALTNATVYLTAPSIADLDGDGSPEIIVGATVFDHAGNLLWAHPDVGQGGGYGAISTTADLDLDGVLEVVSGFQAYRADGSAFYATPGHEIQGGYPAVGNFDDDPFPEVAVVSLGYLYLVRHDGTVKWGPIQLPGGGLGGPPTIADFDGDGRPEIGVAGAFAYTVFRADGSVLWSSTTRDGSSNITGSSVFDFQHDGRAEVVYNDELFLRIFDGPTGQVLFKDKNPSCTATENPVVADVDNDGHADVVVTRNNICGFGSSEGVTNSGVFVYTGQANNWVRTRRIWNEHSYHVTNVNEDGSIPAHEVKNWLASGLNNFRQQAFAPGDPDQADRFTYQASDGQLASNTATVSIAVLQPNNPPTITSTPVLTAAATALYLYAVQASDPDAGDVLTFSLPTAPPGMTIDPPTGLIQWTPTLAQMGSQSVVVKVTDSHGLFALQPYTVTVGAAPTPTPVPSVTPTPTATPASTPGATGTPVTTPTPAAPLVSISVSPATDAIVVGVTDAFRAIATYGDGSQADVTASVVWGSSAPTVATISASGVATGVAPGTTSISAQSGAISGTALLGVVAVAPGDTTPPIASIDSPDANSEITAPANIVGTATDANFVKYELDVAPAGETTFTHLATGLSPVAGGLLGVLDPTLLLNGPYTLRLRVYDAGGNVAEASIVVIVARALKVGLYSVSFTDLQVALSGIPIKVTRTYDNRNKTNGDFGVGWRLDVQTLRVRTNRVLGTGWTTQNVGLSVQLVPLDDHYVTITLADGTVETFDLQLSPTSQPFSLDATNVVGFVPRPGTLGTLEGLDNGSLLVVPGGTEVELWDDATLQTYDPRRFRYTTKDGEKIVVDRVTGVESITDLNGNSVTFATSSITHSSGVGLSLVRDAQGRITKITDPSGGMQTYAYDAAGDLRSHTSAVGNVTRFEYDGRHNLTGIVDPSGAPVARNEYDSAGRLIATVDAHGNRVSIENDLSAMQQVVRDRLGNPTIYAYDTVGNIVSRTDALGGVTTYSYDARGNQLSETDPLGRTATRAYDARNDVLSRTDLDGNTTSYTYNARGKILTTTDAEGRTTTNIYGANDNLLQTTSPEGGVTSYSYDASGNRLSKTDPLGNVTTFTYDAAGRELSSTDPLGNVTTRTYDASGRLLTETNPDGTAGATYDADGRVLTSTDQFGNQRTLGYSPIGDGTKIASLGTPGGNLSTLGYDTTGQITGRTFPGGGTDATTYDAEGRVVSSTDRDGRTTSFEYDALGRRTKVTHPDGGTEITTYDAVGRVLSKADENGHVTTYSYGPNTQTVTDALGNATVHEFDGEGRRVKTTDALGRVTTFAYDSAGNLLSTVFADGTTSTATYDLAGRKTAETDQAGRTTQYGYDALGRLARVTDALGGVTTYTYDFSGNLLSQTDANGHATTMTYDALGHLLSRTRPLGQTETFTYDVRGHQATHTDSGGAITTFTHDALGRLVQKGLPDGSVVSYAYTPAGLRTQAGGDTYSYDARGRLVQETKASGDVLSYTWDTAGNRTSVTTSQGTTTYTYDALNRLATVSDASGGVTSYGYDAVGNLISTTYPNGTSTAYAYDMLNRLTSVVNTGPGGLISSYTYTLGPAGNRVQVVEAGPATGGRTVAYAHDALYRLTGETIDAPGTADDLLIAYAYDAVGNRLQMTRGAAVTTYVYDANDRLLTETRPGGAVTYGYDAGGNMVSRDDGPSSDTYAYDAEDRMIGATVESGANPGTVTYEYDADGLRISRTASGVTTTYLQDKSVPLARVLVEQGPGVTTTYTWGEQLVSQTRTGSGTHFHLTDGELSVRQLTTTSGAVSDAYTYDAFGVLLSSVGTTPNAYRYTGEPLDPNVGFTYLRARWYDHATGRFTSTDPRAGSIFDPVSLHRYLYANANPVDNRDPSGEAPSLAESLVVLALETILVFGLALVFTRDVKRAALIARDNALYGLVIIFVLFAVPFVVGAAGAAAGTATATAATSVVEGRLALRIIKELGEFLGQDTLKILMARATNLIRSGNRAFDLLPSSVQSLLRQASPKVLQTVKDFVAAIKPLTTLPGTKNIFRSPQAIKDFQEFVTAVLNSIPK